MNTRTNQLEDTMKMTSQQAIALVAAYRLYCTKYRFAHDTRLTLTQVHALLVSKGYEYDGRNYCTK